MTIMRSNMAKQISQPGAVKGDPVKHTGKVFMKEMKRLAKGGQPKKKKV